MDTELASRLLALQHQHIDEGVAGAADGTGTLAALAASLKLLRVHLYVEETVLFPPLVAAGLAMPVFVMRREHGQMWPFLTRLDAACAVGADMASLHDDAATLLRLLKMHNPKEEQIVYTAADRYAAAHPDAPLAETMAAARMPEGWVCAMAPKPGAPA